MLDHGLKPNTRGRPPQISSLVPLKQVLNRSKHLAQKALSVMTLVSRIDAAMSTSLAWEEMELNNLS